MSDAAACDNAACLNQFFDDGCVCFSFFAFVIKDLKSRKEGNMGQEFRCFAHVVGHAIHPIAFDKTFIVVRAVAWRGVNKPCACVIGDVVAVDHWHVVGPEFIHLGKRVRTDGIRHLIVGHICHAGKCCDA